MKKNIINFFAFFALTLAFASISAMAQARNSTTTDRIPLSGNFDFCNGEVIDYEGVANLVTHFTVSNTGQVTIKEIISINLNGVSQTTGAKYSGNAAQQLSQHGDIADLAPYIMTKTIHINLIGPGSAPNTRGRLVTHITVNANGEVTSTKFDLTSECR